MPKNKGKTTLAVSRKDILRAIRSNLDQVQQWVGLELWDNAAKYASKAEAGIELLEVADCGSTGGFDVGQDRDRNWTLEDRYVWLKSN